MTVMRWPAISRDDYMLERCTHIIIIISRHRQPLRFTADQNKRARYRSISRFDSRKVTRGRGSPRNEFKRVFIPTTLLPRISANRTWNHLGADGAANETDREEIKISKVAGEEAEHSRYTARPRLTIERARIEPGRLPPSVLINGSRVVT